MAKTINWKKIAAEYIRGDIAMRPLAKKHNVSFKCLSDKARKENWTLQRNEYRVKTGYGAVDKTVTNPEQHDIDAAALIFEGAELAIKWIVNRLNSGEISDYREVESLIRSMNGAKGITNIKMALEEREQRARIASLEKDTEVKGREPVVVEIMPGTEGAAR